MSDYKIYYSDFIKYNHRQIVDACGHAKRKIAKIHPNTNLTLSTNAVEMRDFKNHEGYLLYNIFQLSAPNSFLYGVFKELVYAIRDYTSNSDLYLQAWLNYQRSDQVLNWHRHEGYLYHGYICIDPKNTCTEFETYSIENEVGLIYLGEGTPRHRVVNLKNFDGFRITIGFDLISPSNNFVKNQGFIPIL